MMVCCTAPPACPGRVTLTRSPGVAANETNCESGPPDPGTVNDPPCWNAIPWPKLMPASVPSANCIRWAALSPAIWPIARSSSRCAVASLNASSPTCRALRWAAIVWASATLTGPLGGATPASFARTTAARWAIAAAASVARVACTVACCTSRWACSATLVASTCASWLAITRSLAFFSPSSFSINPSTLLPDSSPQARMVSSNNSKPSLACSIPTPASSRYA